MVQITAKAGSAEDSPSVTIEYEVPESLKDKVAKFGEDAVNSRAGASIVIDLQGWMRSQLRADPPKTKKEIQKAADDWKPGTKKRGKSTVEKATEAVSKLSADERAALLKELKAEG